MTANERCLRYIKSTDKLKTAKIMADEEECGLIDIITMLDNCKVDTSELNAFRDKKSCDREIFDSWKSGKTQKELSLKYGLTIARVSMIICTEKALCATDQSTAESQR